MNNIENCRKDVIHHILPFARQNDKIVLLICDMGFGVVDRFKGEFPNRVYNIGTMEQGTVGIAAGMAMTGLLPIVYSIVNFLVYRSLEQIRNDVVLQQLNVKFIGTGANDYFRFLGHSHCCGDDDKKIFDLINLCVFDPYEKPTVDFQRLVKEWIMDPNPGYIRV